MSQRKIDLSQVSDDYTLEIKSVEHPDDRASRLRKDEAEATHQRWRTSILFYTGVGVALLVGGLCLWAALDARFSAEQQRWASALVTSMITGIVGFLTGKNSK